MKSFISKNILKVSRGRNISVIQNILRGALLKNRKNKKSCENQAETFNEALSTHTHSMKPTFKIFF